MNDAIQLRREVPERSVSQIIFILEQEGKAAPGVLKRPTLERHLLNAGFGSGQLKMYKDDRQTSSKRFCKPHRMMLAQCDIKYGPKLPIGKNGAKVQTYVCSVIDDHSRFVLYSHIYATQDETIVEDTLHKAISLYGKMDLLYCDNGKQFISVQLKYSLSRLGIRVSHAKPRSAKSKGKVEKYQDTINTFIREIELKKLKSLDEATYYWDIYLQQYYLDRSHEGIKEYYESFGVTVPDEGISPKAEFYRDTRPLTFLSEDVVAEAFLHHEKRKVNRGACVKFRGREYETRPELIGYQVDISYDPGAPETITISYPGIEPFTARPVKIGEYCDKNPTLPVAMLDQKPTTSRFLDALERKHNETMEQRADAISFGNYRKDGDENHV